ncbi:ribosomal protein S6 kinase alpha-1 [Mizuhopecten yessoensis]|uniref:Ribosomal protein S6 kinase alpha-1 n=1 Tax=Mizuhopecten yessoensis TaxID=6573 RepID=A0A210PVX9_MIZYE|nr:ribosomal protein S6 kinase alpha-1 [Mizuhopecten yessoensis]
MDFKCVKRTFREAGGVFVSKNNSTFHKKTTVYPNDLNFVKQEPRRYDILSSLASCFPHGNLRDNIEIYVSCATGLYNVCDDAKWKCISQNDDSLYHHLLQQKYREDSLTKLGVGKDVSAIPNWIRQLVMNEIRPKTANVDVQATPDMQDFGVQAKPVETSEMNMQTSVEMLDFGVQAVPTKTTNIQTQTVNETSQEVVSSKNVTLQVHLTRDGKLNSISTGGLELELDDDDSNIILEILRRNIAKKTQRSIAATASVAPAPAPAPAPVPVPVPTSQSRPPGFGLNPNGQDKRDTSKTSIVCQENQQKATTGTVTRYHPKLPAITYFSNLPSNSSPFRGYGYAAPDDMPSTMVDVRIPIVLNHEIILKRRENSRQLHILGNGSYGFVYMAEYYKNPLASICVKDFDPDNSSTFDIYQETQTLLYLQSTQFVPKCYGLMESPITPISGAFALVQECFAGGCTLKNLIVNPPATFGKWNWVCIIYQLFHGLDIIHNKHVLINDIKTDNILVDVQGDELSNLRYIDLGLASFRCGHRLTGNPQYMAQFVHLAPEVRRGFFSTPASDVYSVGVIVNEIYSIFHIKELESIVDMTMKDNPARRDKCDHILQKLEGVLYL